jgi:hypothetical protein
MFSSTVAVRKLVFFIYSSFFSVQAAGGGKVEDLAGLIAQGLPADQYTDVDGDTAFTLACFKVGIDAFVCLRADVCGIVFSVDVLRLNARPLCCFRVICLLWKCYTNTVPQ